MRDDVKDLFCDLLCRLESKTKLLYDLLQNEKSASDLIKNRNDAEDKILEIIESETALIDEINAEDFNISQIRDEITRKYRFDFNKLCRKDYSTSETEILHYMKEVNLHETIIDEILSLKKQNNIRMENTRDDLQIQISELERMSRIKIVLPKDLRSS